VLTLSRSASSVIGDDIVHDRLIEVPIVCLMHGRLGGASQQSVDLVPCGSPVPAVG
jgi:hypothetical protein